MIVDVQNDHRHSLDQLARPRIRQVDHSGEQHPIKIDKDGRRHSPRGAVARAGLLTKATLVFFSSCSSSALYASRADSSKMYCASAREQPNSGLRVRVI
jgi:hypothetical protein